MDRALARYGERAKHRKQNSLLQEYLPWIGILTQQEGHIQDFKLLSHSSLRHASTASSTF
jgi:hypothetical protein